MTSIVNLKKIENTDLKDDIGSGSFVVKIFGSCHGESVLSTK